MPLAREGLFMTDLDDVIHRMQGKVTYNVCQCWKEQSDFVDD